MLQPAPVPDIRLQVHGGELGNSLLAEALRDHLELWVQVDMLGLGDLILSSDGDQMLTNSQELLKNDYPFTY